MKNRLTKTAYLKFLMCPNEFWLSYQPFYQKTEPDTLEYEHLRQQGYDVERFVKQLERFQTDERIQVDFQRAFQTMDLYAKSDVVVTDRSNGEIDIYEIKSSSKVKPEHLEDVAFQKIVAQQSGFIVKNCYVLILNGEYTRNGEIDPEQLFKIEDVTEQISCMISTTESQIDAAIAFADSVPVPSLVDYCPEKLDCEYVRLNFPDLPDYTVFNISRINKGKLTELLERNILDIRDIPDGFKLSDKQQIHVTAAKTGQPIIDAVKIIERISSLPYPLHFLDYETFSYAIPQFDGVRPFQQMCFQYSLHTIHEKGGEPEHKAFLARSEENPPYELAARLKQDLSDNLGTVFVWYEGFEKTRNEEMAVMFPEFTEFFNELNARTYDLMKIFSDNLYVHPAFKGSSSIKKVLPVLCPHLSYKELGIGDGLTASISWYRAVKWDNLDDAIRNKTFSDLDAYCHLDTKAMVEIFYKLLELENPIAG